MAAKTVEAAVFPALRAILSRVAADLAVQEDSKDSFYLNTKGARYKGKPVFFGAVQRGKKYVSFHLFPLYMNPEMVSGISPALKKRMQGKACFNFMAVDEALFAELEALVKAGVRGYRERGWL
jgi:hypothetical protein